MMSMRRLCLTLLCGLVAVPTALAASRTSAVAGDGVLEFRSVNASSANITGTRGTIWGQLDKGKLIVTDPVLGDGQIYVSGAEKTHIVDENVTVYWGTDLHFRVIGGKYKLAFKNASGLDLTAVGVGTAVLVGDITYDDTGDYARDGGKWIPVPYIQRSITFGVLPVPPSTP
jgi:hypothetical protein